MECLVDSCASLCVCGKAAPVASSTGTRCGRNARLTGTDLGTREIYPGFSVHDELALLVERAGLTPLKALGAATRNPARYLAADSLGTVAAGRLADFVLLDASPLEDIRNTSRIRGVAVNGLYRTRPELDALMAGVERRVAQEDIGSP